MTENKALEKHFQAGLIERLRLMFKGCLILKLDPDYIQGIPDLLILWRNKWATLECKRHVDSPRQPNQEYYVNRMKAMSFSAFISPENEEEVLHELQQSFQA